MRWLAITLILVITNHRNLQAQETSPHIPLVLSKPDRFIFFPLIVKSPEYKWGAGTGGIIYFKVLGDSIARTSNIKIVTFVTLRRQLVFASEGTFYLPGEKYIFHYAGSVSHFPDKFWGVGNDSPAEALENYTISQYGLYPQFLREIHRHLFAGIGYEFQHVYNFQYNDNNGESIFDTQDITGRYGGVISGAGLIVTWDSRDNAFSASKGFYIQYFNNFYRDFLGSDFNFVVQNLDIRKYFGLKKNRVIAFQLNLTSAHGDIPIRNLSVIGSDSYMRGYYQGRYQDRTMFAFQGEYRTPVWKRFGVAVFTGIGKVGPSASDVLDFTSLKVSGGVGVRFALNPKEKLNLRFDAGFGKNAHGSYLNMGEAF